MRRFKNKLHNEKTLALLLSAVFALFSINLFTVDEVEKEDAPKASEAVKALEVVKVPEATKNDEAKEEKQ
ncbi:MAG: hypothetical protein LBS40_01275 [Burkholderiales bacterium]|jgi:hypothetical protein|nr:hypothetical protein [Burkholderiales bacterium]